MKSTIHRHAVSYFLRTAAPACLCVVTASAQGTISTERPGLLISPALLPEHMVQIEAGLPNIVFNRGDGADSTAYSFPTLVRYGAWANAEVRLFSSMWNAVRDESGGSTETTDGFGDVELSTKIALCTQDGFRPLASMIAGVRLPTGADEFSSHQPGYSLNFAGDWDLGRGNTLRGLAGVVRTPSGGDDITTGNLGILLNHALDARWGVYTEAGFFPSFDSTAEDQAFAGGGVAYLLSDDVQFDAFGDFGLNSDSPDATVGVGLSWRF